MAVHQHRCTQVCNRESTNYLFQNKNKCVNIFPLSTRVLPTSLDFCHNIQFVLFQIRKTRSIDNSFTTYTVNNSKCFFTFTVFKFTRNKQRKIAKAHTVHFQTQFDPLKMNCPKTKNILVVLMNNLHFYFSWKIPIYLHKYELKGYQNWHCIFLGLIRCNKLEKTQN